MSAPADAGPSVLTAGFLALDAVRHNGRVTHHAGGTAANVAANLASLGWRAAVAGLIGEDGPGRLVRRDLERAGVDTGVLEMAADAETPVVIEEVRNGRHTFAFTCPECERRSARSRPPRRENVAEATADVFFFDRTSVAALELARVARGDGALVVFEPSSRGGDGQRADALALAHVVKLSADNLPELDGEILATRAGQLQVVTDAAKGLRWRIGAGVWQSQHAFPVRLVDSCGAGDWLTAGLIAQLPKPSELGDLVHVARALEFGQALAAHSCTRIGAAGLRAPRPGRPHRDACPTCARL